MKKLIILCLALAFNTIALSQFTKKQINTVAAVVDTLGTIKTAMEEYMTDVLTWKNDSIVGLAKDKYVKIRGKVSGTLKSVTTYIMFPPGKRQAEQQRSQLNKQLKALCDDLTDFSTFYVKSDLYIRKGAGMSNSIGVVIGVIIEIGTKLYDAINKISTAQRQALSDKVSKDCNLVEWKSLQQQ